MTVVESDFIQTPSTLWVPEHAVGTVGDEINDLGNLLGIPGDATQQRDVNCFASYDEHGRWVSLENCIVEGRQNGKTKSVLLRLVLGQLLLSIGPPDRVFWTAHLMKTTLDTFKEVKLLIDKNALFSKRVKKIREENGDEGIDFTDGSVLDFIARTKGGGRGLSGKTGVFDETLFLQAAFMGALMPTLSSRNNPWILYGSSAGKQESSQLRALQSRGRGLSDPSLTFIEYKSRGSWDEPGCEQGVKCSHLVNDPGRGICAMDDEDNWADTNHAIRQGRMRVAFVRAERRALCQTKEGVIEFGRERMGWSEDEVASYDPDRIPRIQWVAAQDILSEIDGEVVFAIDAPPSQDTAYICVAGVRADGDVHFGIVDSQPGMNWVPARLTELMNRHETMCDPLWMPTAPIGALRERLRDEGVGMYDIDETEFSEFCGSFKAHFNEGDIHMRPSETMDAAFKSAERKIRPEGSWTWGRRKSSGSIAPIIGSTLAVGGVDRFGRRDPQVLIF